MCHYAQLTFPVPAVTVGQYRNTLGKFIEAAGYKDSMEFFKEIPPELDQQLSQPQPQQQQPNPALDALMAQTQAQIEVDRAKALNDIEIAKAKAQASIHPPRGSQTDRAISCVSDNLPDFDLISSQQIKNTRSPFGPTWGSGLIANLSGMPKPAFV